MIIIIAPEQDIANEMETLNRLFEAGLEYYHLRKPYKNYEQHCAYLNRVDKKYHSKIVVHSFHEIAKEYQLKGIHFQEQKRRELLNQNIGTMLLKAEVKIAISSSFHSPEELAECETKFDYHLLSPIFSSISKSGYKGKGFDVNHIDKKIIGMGGVTTENLGEFTKLGYKGVGVLGGIWNSKDPIFNFNKMKDTFKIK